MAIAKSKRKLIAIAFKSKKQQQLLIVGRTNFDNVSTIIVHYTWSHFQKSLLKVFRRTNFFI